VSHALLLTGFVIFAAVIAATLGWLVAGRRRTTPILRAGAFRPPPPTPSRASLETAVRAIAGELSVMAQRSGTGLAVDLPAGVALHLAPTLIHEALREVLYAAIRAAPGGMVGIGVIRRGRRMDITIADDGPVLDEVARRVSLAGAASLLAPYGIEVTVQPRLGLGTTVTLRIPAHLVAEGSDLPVAMPDTPRLVTSAC